MERCRVVISAMHYVFFNPNFSVKILFAFYDTFESLSKVVRGQETLVEEQGKFENLYFYEC